MEDQPVTPPHAPPEPEQRPDHNFALYHGKSNTTLMPFIVTKHANGEIVSAIAKPKLQKSQGHIAALPLGEFDTHFKQRMPVWVATADGFRYANTIAGWSITYPQQIHVPGVQGIAPNPYIEVDKSGAFVMGFARAIGIGRAALTGDLMIVDRPTHISVQSYIEEDLAGKAQYNPTSIVWGVRDMNPMDAVRDSVRRRNEEILVSIEFEKDDWKRKKLKREMTHEAAVKVAEDQHIAKLWRFFPISRVELGKSNPTDVGLWANMGATVVTRVFTTLVGKRKFGARLLPAIAERNVLRTALGFYRAPEGITEEFWPQPDGKNGQYNKAPRIIDAVWSPPVTVHRMNFTAPELNDLRSRYLAGMEGGILRQAKVDRELIENSSDDLMLIEPTGDPHDGARDGVVIELPPSTAGAEQEVAMMDERQRLIVESNKYMKLVDMDLADQLRKLCFDDPVFVNLDTEPLESVRKFVGHLKKQVEKIAVKEVPQDTTIISSEGPGDG